ncbi:type II secretion system protein [Candidatus Saccharibacteria bacterium]|nr:type II secretion system protein [Candidatus Saccharibacteria bacterium]
MQNIKSKKGFTIIEVVLVLAIAGLIFLMVFIALPAMQRNQRDTQRRNDYSALSTAITNYMTNNNGRFPGECSTTVQDGAITSIDNGICQSTMKYINSQNNNGSITIGGKNIELADDPSGNDYYLNVVALANSQSNITELTETDTTKGSIVYVYQQADCGAKDANDQSKPKYKKGSRNFAIYGQLENGTYCAASS